jgi:predicted nucleotidyltransferase component of viral defense system
MVEFYGNGCYNYPMTEELVLLRKATQKEMDFYYKILYPIQDRVLEKIQSKGFYLTGGTPLSRIYFHHRFSDDLDFFYDGFKFPKEDFNFSYREILYNLEKIFDKIEVSIDGDFFKRIFVTANNTVLKIEFVYENYKTVGEKNEFKGVLIDSKENICANKIGTVSDRRMAKDFLDLFFLLKEIQLEQAVKWSELKRVPPDLLKIPFEILKSNIHHIDVETLRTSETRRRFVKEIQNYIDSSSDWDETLFKIAGII